MTKSGLLILERTPPQPGILEDGEMPTPSAYGKLLAEHERLQEAYPSLYIAAQIVSDEMKSVAGGSAYEFEGSTNHIDNLREQLDRVETEDELCKVAYPEKIDSQTP